ncbi:hypothetical protein PG984_010630 [Apiospora sp. TS-2023a]
MKLPKTKALITGCSNGGSGAAMAKAGTLRNISDVKIVELDDGLDSSIARCADYVRELTGGTLDVLVKNANRDFVILPLDVNMNEANQHDRRYPR